MLSSVLGKRTDLPRPNGLRQVVSRVCGAQIRLFLSATLCAAMAALPLRAAELAHRWSFVSDFSDSAGGSDATPCGTSVSLYGGRVHTGYGGCTHGTGYVNLGTNVLDASSATPLADAANPTRRSFPLAADATRVSAIRFDGETRLASLFGAYEGTLPGSGTTMMILR